ncbi:MAG TPA: hypothetical protein PLG90_05380 [Ignavibacteria bacterium]|nr:hypothetical protein [Ignavibacteria bacterium]
MKIKSKLKNLLFLSLSGILIYACGEKKDEPVFVPPNQEFSADQDQEQKAKEEFERLKKLEEMQKGDSNRPVTPDTVISLPKDSVKTDTVKPKEKKVDPKTLQKEKELNKKLTNPKTTIDDYLEYIKRGVSEDGNFDKNMKRASELWDGRGTNTFKRAYKDTKKFSIISEPEVVSQKGNTAKVKVKIKQTDKNNKESEIIVTYNLVADNTGKWKIKNNVVSKK